MSSNTPTNPLIHSHSLKIFKPGRKPKNILRSLVGSLKYGKPDTRKLSSVAEDLDLKGCDGISSEKYGVSREVIGSGGSSIVWLLDSRDSVVDDDKNLLAVKGYRPKSGSTEGEFKKRLQEEHDLLSSLHHPNVLRSLDLLQNEKGSVFEVLEFCAGGDLHSLIIERGKLEAAEADCFFKQLMSGVRYLHENGIAHRDLKPENLVLTAEGVVKIVDFGESERFRDVGSMESDMATEVVGTAPYISPESYSDSHFDLAAADVWATGVIYMVLRLGRYLWRKADDTDEFYEKYVRDRRTELGFAHIENLGREDRTSVIYTILDPRANRRLTASQFHLTQWAKRIEVCKGVEQSLRNLS